MAWMITEDKLDPEQRGFINTQLRQNQNLWIKGWAGSGKTVLLVHALREKLAEDPNLNICIVSFTLSLIDMMRTGLEELGISHVPIMTYYQFKGEDQTYDYIFCDEVQDLPASVLGLMRTRSKYVIVSGDSNQSIYDKRVTPSEIGSILNATSFELTFIHRLTRSIINAVSKLLPNINIFAAKRDMTKQDVDIRLIKAYDQEDEVKYIWSQASSATSIGDSAVVLLPMHVYIKEFVDLLCEVNSKPKWSNNKNKWGDTDYDSLNKHFESVGIKAEYIGNKYGSFQNAERNRNLIIMTYHSSKGMDFDNVFLPFLSNSTQITLKKPDTLLMVAMTRSKKNLFITYSGFLHQLVERFESLCTKINPNRPTLSGTSDDFDF
jgi:superfamily I DNA/RNA helicase